MKTRIHIILRSFNSNKIIDILKKFSLFPIQIASVNVVIDKKRDLINTPNLLKELNYPYPIKLIQLENYGWSKALNAAIIHLMTANSSTAEFIMPISNEVMIEPEHFRLLLDAVNQEKASCGYALFKDRYEASYSIPRNTCIIWKLNLFSIIGLFDECLDNLGGMEDYEMVLRSFYRLRFLPFVAKKRIELIMRDPENFQKKIEMEENSLKNIEANYPIEIVNSVKKHLRNQTLEGEIG